MIQVDQREDYEKEIRGRADDPIHETFEQEFGGTPEDVELETEKMGMGIAIDEVIFADDEQTQIIEPR